MSLVFTDKLAAYEKVFFKLSHLEAVALTFVEGYPPCKRSGIEAYLTSGNIAKRDRKDEIRASGAVADKVVARQGGV